MSQHMRGDFSQSRFLLTSCNRLIHGIPAKTGSLLGYEYLSLSLLASDSVLSASIYWRLYGELYICQELNISNPFGFFVVPFVSCDKVTVIENS